MLRLIGKWLNAGVLENGILRDPTEGTPQGGVISPLLANIHLHYVLDEWFDRDVRPGVLDWASFRRLLARYPLPPPRVLHSLYRSVANP